MHKTSAKQRDSYDYDLARLYKHKYTIRILLDKLLAFHMQTFNLSANSDMRWHVRSWQSVTSLGL